jgi:hypothetical protein
LDGDHSENAVRKDLFHLAPHFSPRALVLFHDCAPWSLAAGPRRVSQEWIDENTIQPIEQTDSILVAQFQGFKSAYNLPP